jgi:hypothetical protein
VNGDIELKSTDNAKADSHRRWWGYETPEAAVFFAGQSRRNYLNMDTPSAEQFRDTRENLMPALAMTEQEAADHLTDVWTQQNRRPRQDNQLDQQQANLPAKRPANPS